MKSIALKRSCGWLLAAGVLLTVSGCTVVEPEKEKKDDGPHTALLSELSAEERAELLKFGKNAGDTLLAAIKSGNRACMAELPLHPEVTKSVTDESFQKLVQQLETNLGVITEQTYLTNLRLPLLETFVWKVEFTKKSTEEGKAPELRDMLFMVSVGRPDGKWQVMGFFFKL